jgi:hypothetical protein
MLLTFFQSMYRCALTSYLKSSLVFILGSRQESNVHISPLTSSYVGLLPFAVTVALPLLPSCPEYDASETSHDAYDCGVHVTSREPSCFCRPRAAAGRPLAGLEVVEKLLTSTIYPANRTAWARSSAPGIVAP